MGRILICLLLAGATAALESAVDPLETKMAALAEEARARTAAGDEAGTRAILLRMAALDPAHPKLHLAIVMEQRSRAALDALPQVLDGLALPAGPGRAYATALAAFFTGDLARAEAGLKSALAGYVTADHTAGRAACHNALGIVHGKRDELAAATAEYETAGLLLRRLGDRQAEADTLANLAILDRKTGRPAQAIERQCEVLAIRERLRDRPGQSRSWHEIGILRREEGDAAGALAAFDAALALRRELHDERGAITTLREAAVTRFAAGDIEGASRDLDEALERARGLTDRRPLADVLLQQGDPLLLRGATDQAVATVESAADLYHELGAHAEEAAARMRIGAALAARGEYRRSRDALLLGVVGRDCIRGTQHEAALRTELGNVLVVLGELNGALFEQERALELRRAAGERRHALDNLNNRGVIYAHLGELRLARRDVEAAFGIAVELDDRKAGARGANNLGVLLAREGRFDEALAHLESARRILKESGDEAGAASVGANLAEVLLKLDRGDEALAEIERALAAFRLLQDRHGEASLLNQLGELRLAQAHGGAAEEAHRQALALALYGGIPEEEWRAQAGIAAALERRGERGPALEHALLVLDGLEDVRAGLEIDALRMRFLASKMSHYERALALAEGEPVSTSFGIVERARARALLDLLRGSRSKLLGRLDLATRRREERRLDELAAATLALATAYGEAARSAARERLDREREAWERHKVEMRQKAPAYGELVYRDPARLADVQAAVLGPGETLLQYFVGEERAWLWIVSRARAERVELPHPAEIATLARELLDAIREAPARLGDPGPERAAGERLARAVLPARLGAAGSRLIVAPDGPLHHVPFEALRVGGRFLVEDHPLAVVPSATALELMRRRKHAAADGFLGIADPHPVSGDWPPLPYARIEVERIAELFAAQARTVLLGESATKAALRDLALERYRFIHFATHGWLDGADSRETGLVLASDGSTGSGLLSLEEVVGLSLAAEVVVLSACRSGLGEPLRGEGLVGLTGGFLHAGADNVLVSLWDVADRATSSLMPEFYRSLRSGADPAAALRAAKLARIRSDGSSGLVQRWAPFVLVGAPPRADGD